jgi:hypothetical protein
MAAFAAFVASENFADADKFVDASQDSVPEYDAGSGSPHTVAMAHAMAGPDEVLCPLLPP